MSAEKQTARPPHTPEPSVHLPKGYKIEADPRFGGLAAYTPERALIGTSANLGRLAEACFANYGRKMDLACAGLDPAALPALIEAADDLLDASAAIRDWAADCRGSGNDVNDYDNARAVLRAALARAKGGAA